MFGTMHRNPSVKIHQFSMIPKPEIPRSSFVKQFNHKTTFDENYLVPIYVDEVLPGDTFQVSATMFARLTTPIFPLMDNMYLDSFFFFVPNRIIWTHWVNFMGEQANPADSISFTVPTVSLVTSSTNTGTIWNYFGLPPGGQLAGTVVINNLVGRSYNKIWNDWFRDENLQNSVTVDLGDGPDTAANYVLLKRGKRHDYFTAGLPWTQKGGAIQALLTGSATVKTQSSDLFTGSQTAAHWLLTTGSAPANAFSTSFATSGGAVLGTSGTAATQTGGGVYPSNLYADLSTATGNTINALRQAFQIQKLLERDARGGTRYTELVRAHFGVVSPDARLQRSEYLGGGSVPVNIAPIPQTSATGLTGGTTPIGTLSAYGTMVAHGHGFTQSFTEHGHIIGLINIRADINYQEGIRKMWFRQTRYDFYFPAFAMLGEQAILNQEIYAIGTPAQDTAVFAYAERWAEYRYHPNLVTGLFNSHVGTPLDTWHLAEKFTALPTLAAAFIQQNTPITRVSAAAVASGHFYLDAQFTVKATRPMPLYSVPGLIDHF